MMGSELNMVSAALGFGMTAAFVVFCCAKFICCRARQADPHPPPPSSPLSFDADFPVDLDRPMEHAHSGLAPLVAAAIPTMVYTCEGFQSKDDAQCSICLSEYKDKEILRIIPTCYHNFHLSCLDIWLQKQTTCPICRISLKQLPCGKASTLPARCITQLPALPENSVNPSPQWFPQINQDRGCQQNRPNTQESVEVVIEIQQ